jgi:hypothetical protein
MSYFLTDLFLDTTVHFCVGSWNHGTPSFLEIDSASAVFVTRCYISAPPGEQGRPPWGQWVSSGDGSATICRGVGNLYLDRHCGIHDLLDSSRWPKQKRFSVVYTATRNHSRLSSDAPECKEFHSEFFRFCRCRRCSYPRRRQRPRLESCAHGSRCGRLIETLGPC